MTPAELPEDAELPVQSTAPLGEFATKILVNSLGYTKEEAAQIVAPPQKT